MNDLQLMETQGENGQSAMTMTLASVKRQINLIQEIMKNEMKDGEHYGKIPGCGDKPALLKAGAEKLNLTFRMAPRYEVKTENLGNGHREYTIVTSLYHIETGKLLGAGLGSCSTMEKKYRYRNGDGEDTGRQVPKEYWDARKANPEKAAELLGGPGFITKKVDDIWKIYKKSEKIDNPDIADVYNTVLKMAKKRSLVDAVLTVTAASDIFTQDIEEMGDSATAPEPVKSPKPMANGKAAAPADPKAVITPGQLSFLKKKLEEMGADHGEVAQFIADNFKKNDLAKLTGAEAAKVLSTWNSEEPPAPAEPIRSPELKK